MSRFESPHIQRMTGYSFGEQPQDAETIKLNTNENPWPPSPAVRDVLSAFDPTDLRRYPPAYADEFRRTAAQLHGVEAQNIIATNGGDELLRLVLTTFLQPGRTLATTDPSYSLYPVLAAVQNSPVLAIPLQPDRTLPASLAAQANGMDAGVLCIVNPHAPTGALFPVDDMERVAREFAGVLLIDEAYVDFVDPAIGHDCTQLAMEHDNVMLLRSMSKGYALAGLRFGYGIGHADLVRPMLEKTRDSYNVDVLSQRIASAALADREWALANWSAVRDERARLGRELTELGFAVEPSQTNFLLARVPDGVDAAELKARLAARSILVRYFAVPGLDDRLRISIGTPAETDALLDALNDAQNPA